MLALLAALLVVSIPVALAARTYSRVTRTLGALDGALVGAWLDGRDAAAKTRLDERVRASAPGSIVARLLEAAEAPAVSAQARELALAEAVADVERDLIDDARVPRVAASLATSGGLLAATLVMRSSLANVAPVDDGANVVKFFAAAIERGLTLAAVAVLGGVVCAALHRRAQRERKLRLAELDALIAALMPKPTTDASE